MSDPFEPTDTPRPAGSEPAAAPPVLAPPTTPGEIPLKPPPAGGLAIASMVLGIVGVFVAIFGFCVFLSPVGCLLGLVAIVLGWVSLAKRKAGRGKAWTGIITGIAAILIGAGFVVLMTWMITSASSAAQASARNAISSSNLQVIGNAMTTYAADNKGQLPPASVGWEKALDPYLGGVRQYDSPAAAGTATPSYIYVPPPADGAPSNGTRIVLYENPALALERYGILYADGSVVFRSKAELERLLDLQMGKTTGK